MHKNYPLTKKSKNARMGKGKGTISRYCSRVFQNHNLLEFVGFNLRELIVLKKFFKKKVNIPTKINSNFFFNNNYIFNCKNQNFFFIKGILSKN